MVERPDPAKRLDEAIDKLFVIRGGRKDEVPEEPEDTKGQVGNETDEPNQTVEDDR